jgi:FKBP-type peptidyl-prolyl cis-trans isomerase FkpA
MTRKLAMGALLVAAVATAAACQGQGQKKDESKAAGGAAAMTEDDKTIYLIGLRIGGQAKILNLSAAEVEVLKRGVADAAMGKKPEIDPEAYGPKVQPFAQARMQKAAEASASAAPAEKLKGTAFADAAAKEPGAMKTETGIVFKSLSPGTGKSPVATDTVKVHYRGTFVDGTEFDSSIKRGEPVDFALNGVIPCWTEGLQKMKVGEKARLVCPSSTAYGDQGRPNIPGGATLVFEVELLAIKGK